MRAELLATRRWLERVVIGLSLCPWAKPVHDKQAVRLVHTAAHEAEDVLDDVLREIDALAARDDFETTIVVAPNAFVHDFVAFNDFLSSAEGYLQDEELHEDFQLVGFHPHFRFAGESPDDASNFVNRSPHPSIHVLRQADVTNAIEAQPKLAESVPTTNAERLRVLGSQRMRQLIEDCASADWSGEDGRDDGPDVELVRRSDRDPYDGPPAAEI